MDSLLGVVDGRQLGVEPLFEGVGLVAGRLQLELMRDLTLSSVPKHPEYEARSLPLPPAHVIAELSNFREASV